MAQIRIEEDKNKSGSILPWILGALLLALGIWGITELFDEGDPLEYDLAESAAIEDDPDFDGSELRDIADVGADVDDDVFVIADVDGVREFMTFTDTMEGNMSLDHEFSHMALSRLATATLDISEEADVNTSNIEGKMNQVMRLADDITKDPMATDHADKIRMAAMLITESLEEIDGELYGNRAANDISMLRKEAQAINSKTLTLDQKEDVRSFFRAARNVLSNMS